MTRVPDSTTIRQITPPSTVRYPYVSENLERIVVSHSSREPASPETVRWPYPEGCIVWLGEWEEQEDGYRKYDAVYYGGSSYVSNVENNTDTPPSSQWDLLAQRGSAGGLVFLSFAYGDANPVSIESIGEDGVLGRVELYIDEAFDGVGAGVSVGTDDDHEQFMSLSENDPSVISSFYTHPGYKFTEASTIKLYIIPGSGAEHGTGTIVLHIIE